MEGGGGVINGWGGHNLMSPSKRHFMYTAFGRHRQNVWRHRNINVGTQCLVHIEIVVEVNHVVSSSKRHLAQFDRDRRTTMCSCH